MTEARHRPFSRPVFDQVLALRSEQAQRVMARVFHRVVQSFYTIDVILQVTGRPEEVQTIELVVSQLLTEVLADLKEAQLRLDQLRLEHGVTGVPRYTHPTELTVRIVSPQVTQWAALVERLDELLVTLDALWLSGVIASRQRVDEAYQWQQRLLKLGRRIISIELRARRAMKEPSSENEAEGAGNPESLAAPIGLGALASESVVPVT
jgi:hypothetical protein